MLVPNRYKQIDELYEEFEFIDFIEEFKAMYKSAGVQARLTLLKLYITKWHNAETFEFIEDIIKEYNND